MANPAIGDYEVLGWCFQQQIWMESLEKIPSGVVTWWVDVLETIWWFTKLVLKWYQHVFGMIWIWYKCSVWVYNWLTNRQSSCFCHNKLHKVVYWKIEQYTCFSLHCSAVHRHSIRSAVRHVYGSLHLITSSKRWSALISCISLDMLWHWNKQTRWWFQILFISTNTWGNDSHFD